MKQSPLLVELLLAGGESKSNPTVSTDQRLIHLVRAPYGIGLIDHKLASASSLTLDDPERRPSRGRTPGLSLELHPLTFGQ